MIKDDVIELHPENKPAPWISNIVIAPKPGGNIRIKVDARNLKKAIMSTNLPIPQHENNSLENLFKDRFQVSFLANRDRRRIQISHCVSRK